MEKEEKNWHDRTYKFLLVIPAVLLLISLIYLFSFYQQTGDIIRRDISLKGGTTITVLSQTNLEDLKSYLSKNLEEFKVRKISNLKTGEQQAFAVEATLEPDELKQLLEDYLDFELNNENSSTEFTGSTIGEGFYRQLRKAIILAFILMSIVVFIIFRTFIPSLAVVLSAFADIVMTLTLVNIMEIRVSAAGIVAFLMLIGYSVDSDILLTTKILKRREGELNERIFSAFKTGITMTLTSLAAVVITLIIIMSLSSTLKQLFTILAIGLSFDLLNTWISNLGILKIYAEKQGIK